VELQVKDKNQEVAIDRVNVTVQAPGMDIPIMLFSNYPNPFNSETIFKFTTTKSGYCTLTIYDLAGREVRRLLAETLPIGAGQVSWNGRDEHGFNAPSGIYIAIMRFNKHLISQKVTLAR
jgi:hypothetical protein